MFAYRISTLEEEQVVKKLQMTTKANRAAARKEKDQRKITKEAERAAYQTQDTLGNLRVYPCYLFLTLASFMSAPSSTTFSPALFGPDPAVSNI